MASVRRFLLQSPEDVEYQAMASGAIDKENEWGNLVRLHVVLMAGEHADSAERLTAHRVRILTPSMAADELPDKREL